MYILFCFYNIHDRSKAYFDKTSYLKTNRILCFLNRLYKNMLLNVSFFIFRLFATERLNDRNSASLFTNPLSSHIPTMSIL